MATAPARSPGRSGPVGPGPFSTHPNDAAVRPLVTWVGPQCTLITSDVRAGQPVSRSSPIPYRRRATRDARATHDFTHAREQHFALDAGLAAVATARAGLAAAHAEVVRHAASGSSPGVTGDLQIFAVAARAFAVLYAWSACSSTAICRLPGR